MAKRSAKPLLDVDAHMGSDDVAAAIRAELRSLAKSQDNKASPGYTMSVMANVFYDMEDALEAGATLRDVHKIIVDHDVPVPWTRFSHDLQRLRAIFPARKKAIEVDPDLVSAISSSIADLGVESIRSIADKQLRTAIVDDEPETAEAQTEKPQSPAPVRRKPRVNRRMSRRADELPIVERVRLCARAVLDLAQGAETSIDAVSARMRKQLGSGWTIHSTCQFVVGTHYAEWLNAPWPTEEEGRAVRQARDVAMSLVGPNKKVLEKEELLKAAKKAWKKISKSVS